MSRSVVRWIAAGVGIALVAGVVTLLIDDEGGGGTASRTALRPNESLGLTEETDESPVGPEREARRIARSYVAALNDGDGARVCRLLLPGAIDDLELPKGGGGCAGSLTASIGYRDPRGLPVFRDSRITRILDVTASGNEARVTATNVTRFADRNAPSVEDDDNYLTRRGDRWLIAKPSAALYRAIGAEPPPQAISPP